MAKTRIDWANPKQGWKLDETHNIITGCLHGCPYCYARRQANRFPNMYGGPGFKPMFHKDRLGYFAQCKKPRTFFIGSMADMWGEWVPDEWISQVLRDCLMAPWHRYLFLTRNPMRYFNWEGLTENMWFGCTLTGSHSRDELILDMRAIRQEKAKGHKTFLSIEPLLGPFMKAEADLVERYFDLVIVGAMSGPGAVEPKLKWIDSIKHPNIYYKNSIRRLLK